MAPLTRPLPRRASKRLANNRLLALLSDGDREALDQHLEPYPLKQGVTLVPPLAPIENVYFVTEGLVSLVQLLENGKYTEAGIIGREGMVGALAPLGAAAFSSEAVVQIAGSSLRMRASTLRVEASLRPGLRDVLMRYVQSLFAQVTQSVSCNIQHTVPKRLARWLAMAADCAETDTMPLTHELLSTMLGVRRTGVTEGLAVLKKAGLVSLYKGGVRISDPVGLQAATCECYNAVKLEFRRLLGPSIFPERPLQNSDE